LPTYEYACTACGHRLDAVQKFSDEPLTECPECGGTLRKVYGAVGIVLKGSGFYKTDSRVSAGKSGSDSKEANGKESSSNDSKSDTSTKTESTKTESTKPSPTSDSSSKESKTPASTAS
jgi:putative FmdB family regulatory protein